MNRKPFLFKCTKICKLIRELQKDDPEIYLDGDSVGLSEEVFMELFRNFSVHTDPENPEFKEVKFGGINFYCMQKSEF